MFESHNTVFTMHPRGNEISRFETVLLFEMMKKDIVEYVSKCLTCQHVKAEHQVPPGLLNPIPIP